MAVQHQKEVSLRPFSLVLQSLLKGLFLCQVILASEDIRDAIIQSSYHVIVHHSSCPLLNEHLHTTIFHGTTEFSEGSRILRALGIQS
ncbi:hypothetical protein B9Z19DRAFT_1131266 [Tuber borchii]|uniref:Uncharacterized protein n=1 Tax=Tuber borchii TaxID=42251 RepID=A0A2T6ZIZ8_TUBBO|nr:hypothetical protein B9Z19DRAFT_1131266 [Tuber borchii]